MVGAEGGRDIESDDEDAEADSQPSSLKCAETTTQAPESVTGSHSYRVDIKENV